MGGETRYFPLACQETLPGWRERKTAGGGLRGDSCQAYDFKNETEAEEGKAASKVVLVVTQVPLLLWPCPLHSVSLPP